MTESEVAALQDSGLNRDSPFAISPVIGTQFSIARFSGGCKVYGQHYVYDPTSDELVRYDVWRWLTKRRRDQHRAKAKEEETKQTALI